VLAIAGLKQVNPIKHFGHIRRNAKVPWKYGNTGKYNRKEMCTSAIGSKKNSATSHMCMLYRPTPWAV
jgi:hypothetical protein